MNETDFFATLRAGGSPDFLRCECGEMTTRLPCWSCAQREERALVVRQEEELRGIPARYRWARRGAELNARSHVVPSRHYANADEGAARLAASSAIGALLIGPAGSGKTSLAVAAMREVRGSFFVSANALERARIEHRSGEGEAPLVARAKRAPVLVIDDLGQDKPSSVSAVEAVILARHDAELRTWVTTGLDAGSPRDTYPALEARYGAGVVRRLTERGTARVMRFTLPGAA